jgi:hypothetical protein
MRPRSVKALEWSGAATPTDTMCPLGTGSNDPSGRSLALGWTHTHDPEQTSWNRLPSRKQTFTESGTNDGLDPSQTYVVGP